MIQKETLLKVLNSTHEGLVKAADSLRQSLEKCSAIGIKDEYTFSEFESMDSLTSKFGRTSGILIKKYIQTVFKLINEYPDTMIDTLNLAEKHNLITSADTLAEIRALRNEIAHEYWVENLNSKFDDVLRLAPDLLMSIDLSIAFVKSRGYGNK